MHPSRKLLGCVMIFEAARSTLLAMQENWLRNRNTIEFLGVWESLYNPSFNRVEFDAFRSQAGLTAL